MSKADTDKDASFSLSSQSDASSLNVYLAEDGGDKTPDVSFNNSFDNIEVEKEEILRIFHKTERVTDEINELSHTFCDKLIAKNISEDLETDHYQTVTSKKKK